METQDHHYLLRKEVTAVPLHVIHGSDSSAKILICKRYGIKKGEKIPLQVVNTNKTKTDVVGIHFIARLHMNLSQLTLIITDTFFTRSDCKNFWHLFHNFLN